MILLNSVTDAIRDTLKSQTNKIFIAPEILKRLIERGLVLKQQEPLSVIHQILGRLIDRGEVKITRLKSSRKRFQENDAAVEGQPDQGANSDKYRKRQKD